MNVAESIRTAVVITRPTFHAYMVPLGYLYVVATLKRTGLPVEVLDLSAEGNAGFDAFGRALENARFDLVIAGTSYKFHNNCPSATIESALSVARMAKQRRPGCYTLLIGPLNTTLYRALLKDPTVDAVALGEPEEICRDVAVALNESRPLTEVPGLAFRTAAGTEVTGRRPYPELDDLPFPDREAVHFEEYTFDSYFAPRTTEVLTSRGCPFTCTYCFGARTSRRNEYNTGAPFRVASPERVMEEIDLLYHRWGVRGIKFSDVEFCVSPSRVEDICNLLLLEGYRDLYWRAVTHVKSVQPALLRLMHRAGCRNIYYGVESGDEEMLRRMDKRVTLDEIRETFRNTWQAGIKPEASFLLGLPGETEESIEKTIRFACAIRPFLATFHVFVPFPGIPLEAEMDTLASEALDNGDVYQLRVKESYCAIPAERLDALSKRVYRRFYLRPSYLARMILQLKEPAMRQYLLRLARGRNEGGWLRRMLMGRDSFSAGSRAT